MRSNTIKVFIFEQFTDLSNFSKLQNEKKLLVQAEVSTVF